MDDARGSWPLGAAVDGPGAGLLRADGEIGDEVQQLIAGADQAIEAGFLQPQRFEKVGALLARQRRDFRFGSWPTIVPTRQPRLPPGAFDVPATLLRKNLLPALARKASSTLQTYRPALGTSTRPSMPKRRSYPA